MGGIGSWKQEKESRLVFNQPTPRMLKPIMNGNFYFSKGRQIKEFFFLLLFLCLCCFAAWVKDMTGKREEYTGYSIRALLYCNVVFSNGEQQKKILTAAFPYFILQCSSRTFLKAYMLITFLYFHLFHMSVAGFLPFL